MTALMHDPRFAKYAPSALAPGYPDILVVVGAARSGTTFLSYLMRNAFKTPAYGEISNIVSVYRELATIGDINTPENLRRLTARLCEDAYVRVALREKKLDYEEFHRSITTPTTYTGVVYSLMAYITEKTHPEAPILSYKFPPDVLYMDLITQILPGARFIHIVRDGRDVALSLRKVRRWGAKTVWSGMRYWKRSVDSGRHFSKTLGTSRYFELRYEDLLTDPESVAPAFAEYIYGKPDSEAAQRVVDYIASRAKEGRSFAWKSTMTPAEQTISEAVAWDSLRSFGYEVIHDRQPSLSLPIVAGSLVKDVTLRGINRFRREIASNDIT